MASSPGHTRPPSLFPSSFLPPPLLFSFLSSPTHLFSLPPRLSSLPPRLQPTTAFHQGPAFRSDPAQAPGCPGRAGPGPVVPDQWARRRDPPMIP
eukprot:764987-Hanusia_phi.AAC.5